MGTDKRIDAIKDHFEDEAKIYDEIILKLIPFYNEMLEALINSVPFNEDEKINIIDMGCGTGTIALMMKKNLKMQ
jgi:tRNA (cmo5U34)-methyltransferase